MRYNEASAHTLAKSFVNDVLTPQDIESIKGIIFSGFGSLFLKEVLTCEEECGDSKENCISRTMSSLERLVEFDALVGVYLMTKLWMDSDSLYMHHICDAIDMWVDSNRTFDLVALLERDANKEESDSVMIAKYKEWLV